MHEEIEVTVRFEVRDHGCIRFENSRIANMMPRPEIHAHFARLDPRIPPHVQYVDVDDRPYHPENAIMFQLQRDIEIDETADNGPGRLGGYNGHGFVLSEIIYGPGPIDVSKGKISCGKTGPIDSESEDSCPTDSSQDIPGGDTHKLVQITQAIHKQEPVTVCLKGVFKGYQNVDSITHFQRDHVGPTPSSLHELFEKVFQEISASISFYASSGIPGSLLWTIIPFTSDSLSISVSKIGKGLTVSFAPDDLKGVPIAQCPAAYTLELTGKWFISFEAEEQASDATLMQYLVNITVPWDGKAYGQPWQIFLSAQPWRFSDTGEILLAATPDYPQDVDPHTANPRIPQNAAQPRTFISATRPKEIGRILKFGRDCQWPLYISVASTLDGTNSATITYQSPWTECDASTTSFWNQFVSLSAADNLVGLPVAARQNIPWTVTLRKESNSIRVTLHEKTVEGQFVLTPEDDGIPCFLLHGPKATIEMRCESTDVANRYLTIMYGEMPTVTEILQTREWALVASIRNGIIPAKHRVVCVFID
jgi:hypothetical protein